MSPFGVKPTCGRTHHPRIYEYTSQFDDVFARRHRDFGLARGVYLVEVSLAEWLRQKFFDALTKGAFDNQIGVRPLGMQFWFVVDRWPFSQNRRSAEIDKVRCHYSNFGASLPIAGPGFSTTVAFFADF